MAMQDICRCPCRHYKVLGGIWSCVGKLFPKRITIGLAATGIKMNFIMMANALNLQTVPHQLAHNSYLA
jgi:hypothetical protein